MNDKVKEQIDDLKLLRNNYFAMLFLVTGGNVGLLLTEIKSNIHVIILVIGLFFMFISFIQVRSKSFEIKKLIGVIKE